MKRKIGEKRKIDELDSEGHGTGFTLGLIVLMVVLPAAFIFFIADNAMTAVSESVSVLSSVTFSESVSVSSSSSSSSSSSVVVMATEEQPAVPLTSEVECDADALIAAIDAANLRPGLDTLNLRTDCIYTLEGVHNDRGGLNGLPIINDDLTLVGAGGTFIQRGDDTERFRFFYVDDEVTLTLENLTVRGVHGRLAPTATPEPEIDFNDDPDLSFMPDAYDGGAIYAYSGAVTLKNVTLYGFVAAGSGGAVYSYEADVTVTDSAVHDNIAGYAGGAIYSYSGDVTITGSAIHHNRSLYNGGGVYTYSGGITVRDGHIHHNRASDRGGGLYTYKGAMTLRDIMVENNVAGMSGGGLYSYEGLIDAQNFTVQGNTAASDGGGIHAYDANLIIDSQGEAVISGNHAGMAGGGLWIYQGSAVLNTAIITDNTSDRNGGGLWVYAGRVSLLESNLRDNSAAREGDNVWTYLNAVVEYKPPSMPIRPTPLITPILMPTP